MLGGGLATHLALFVFLAVAAAALVRAHYFPSPHIIFDRAREDADAGDRVSLDTVMEVVERLPDPFVLVDGEGRVRLSNQASHSILAAASPGRHISTALRFPVVLEALNRVFEGAGAQSVEFTSHVPVELHMRAFVAPVDVGLPRLGAPPGREGEPVPVALLVLHDLTALKRAEELRADFVANASHELKTPLASLTGFLETLRGHARDDSEARERFLAIMLDQASRMKRLIDDLLSLSRIELNEHVPPSGRVALKPLISGVLEAAQPLAEEEGVALVMNADGEMPEAVGDRDEIFQVVQNLVDNAIRYGGEGGRIDVGVALGTADAISAPLGPMIIVSVRDFGSGIPREHVPRLTERFYRVDAKRSRERGGTGLGLAIVKHIVNRHRGALEIQSRVGEGTEVKVFLPAAAGPAALSSN
ncbi:MAG: hypothetical protein H6923_00655 [Alphaproteobacteria bacterium]|nr:hypothetical protein [Alphaproteobacteria bacterium]